MTSATMEGASASNSLSLRHILSSEPERRDGARLVGSISSPVPEGSNSGDAQLPRRGRQVDWSPSRCKRSPSSEPPARPSVPTLASPHHGRPEATAARRELAEVHAPSPPSLRLDSPLHGLPPSPRQPSAVSPTSSVPFSPSPPASRAASPSLTQVHRRRHAISVERKIALCLCARRQPSLTQAQLAQRFGIANRSVVSRILSHHERWLALRGTEKETHKRLRKRVAARPGGATMARTAPQRDAAPHVVEGHREDVRMARHGVDDETNRRHEVVARHTLGGDDVTLISPRRRNVHRGWQEEDGRQKVSTFLGRKLTGPLRPWQDFPSPAEPCDGLGGSEEEEADELMSSASGDGGSDDAAEPVCAPTSERTSMSPGVTHDDAESCVSRHGWQQARSRGDAATAAELSPRLQRARTSLVDLRMWLQRTIDRQDVGGSEQNASSAWAALRRLEREVAAAAGRREACLAVE